MVKQSMWHQWLNFNFVKLREYFLCAKKMKIIYLTILLPKLLSSGILERNTMHVCNLNNIVYVKEKMRAFWTYTMLIKLIMFWGNAHMHHSSLRNGGK